MKINIDGLHQLFTSKEERAAFENALLGRIKQALDCLRDRVELLDIDVAGCEKRAFEIVSLGDRSAEGQELFEDELNSAAKFRDVAAFDIAEWESLISILWILVGPMQDEGYNGPIDIGSLDSVLDEYQNRWATIDVGDELDEPAGEECGTSANKRVGRRGRPPEMRVLVTARIRQAYTIDELKHGHLKLDALAAEFGCSRTTIRGALAEILANEAIPNSPAAVSNRTEIPVDNVANFPNPNSKRI